MTSRLFGIGCRIALIGAVAALAACDEYMEIRDPKTSETVLNDETVPEIRRISVPMPEVILAPPPNRAEAASLWEHGTSSFFSDRRAQVVGDLVTVMIDINDSAQLRNATSRSIETAQNSPDPVFAGIDASSDSGTALDLQRTSEFSGNGTIRRNESINLSVAALVIEVLPNGNFVIAGRQEVKVNHELRELRVAGIVRPVDISVSNTIAYDQIAEARIAYGGRGQVSVAQRAPYGQDALDIILPY